VVPIDKLVEEPVSSGRSFQPREVRNRRRKAADMGERLVPGKGKASLWERWPGLRPRSVRMKPVTTGIVPIASASR
jgi:hypothetical protein